MATKRMFSRDVVDTDRFLDLPFNSQLLYFHLGLQADSKGFVEPKKVIRSVGLKNEDMKPLVDNSFVMIFSSGVVVVTEWNVHNNIRLNREAPSQYVEEYAQLTLTEQGTYQLINNSSTTPGVLLENSRTTELNLTELNLTERDTPPLKYGSFKKIDQELIIRISEEYEVPIKFVENVKENMGLWLDQTGKKYKDYNAALRNWVKKDRAKYLIEAKRTSKGGLLDATNL